jgi:hypothetical protein
MVVVFVSKLVVCVPMLEIYLNNKTSFLERLKHPIDGGLVDIFSSYTLDNLADGERILHSFKIREYCYARLSRTKTRVPYSLGWSHFF